MGNTINKNCTCSKGIDLEEINRINRRIIEISKNMTVTFSDGINLATTVSDLLGTNKISKVLRGISDENVFEVTSVFSKSKVIETTNNTFEKTGSFVKGIKKSLYVMSVEKSAANLNEKQNLETQLQYMKKGNCKFCSQLLAIELSSI